MQGRILIVDIDADFLTRLEVLFEDKGYHTTTTWGGQEAIQHLQSSPFDLVLLSDYLPDVSSEQLWRALERLPVCPSVAILETAKPVKEIANQYQRLGGRCVLSKASPYKIVEVVCGCLSSGESHQLNWTNAARAAAMNPGVSSPVGQNAS
ncbi:MAG: response regulator [Terriglobia bacterium]